MGSHREIVDASLAIIPLCPLVGAMVAYIVGQKQKDLAGWIATAASTLAFLFVVKNFFALGTNQVLLDKSFVWLSVGNFSIDFAFQFDHLTAVMCLVVTGIGSLIHLYSVGYMAHDESRPRFFAYLNLFLFSMLLLVLGANLLVLFVGWEGVGLCSYLLIGFWHKNIAFAGAGRKAFVVNRIGDAAFLLAMFLIIMNYGSLDFMALSRVMPGETSEGLATLISVLLFIGATGKSAQIPLFVWLPDAMAGPTPVSALIHAATMVTAGVYLMARLNFLFEMAPLAMLVVCMVAGLTALVAATIALVQNDIKKVLAYSTVSQLGFMFLAAGAGAYWVAIFHLVTHAFFKACLFLGSGSVIHACHHEQDMRHMGGLQRVMPFTAATYWISTLAIAGIFPFAGYFSKHHILSALEHAGAHNPQLFPWGVPLSYIATFAAILTAFYVTRSAAMTFLGSYRGHAHPHESPWQMVVPLVVLAGLALVGGVFLEGALSLQHYLGHAIPVGDVHHGESMASFSFLLNALLHSWPGFLGVGLALFLYTQAKEIPGKIARAFGPFTQVLANKYYVDELYGAIIVRPLEGMARFLWKGADQAVIDGSVNGTAAVVEISGELIRTTSTGQLRHYGFFMFVGTLFIIFFYMAL
ncbi:MAG: NADH-quinone oxidoreductase subunit L [Bdellovibrionales bacterium]|nr:NADH-quinone oxidoreductase subunit L [Bdellovibrionales bacterium]